MGRDPRTGERVVKASGSAGRKHLRAGEPTWVRDGLEFWSLADLASRFEVDEAEMEAVVGDYAIDSGRGEVMYGAEAVGVAAEAFEVVDPVGSEGVWPDKEWLSVAEAAAAVGVSPSYLHRQIRDGAIEAKRPENPGWLVKRDRLRDWFDSRQTPDASGEGVWPDKEWLGVAEAAAAVGVSGSYLRRLIRDGVVEGRQPESPVWLVKRDRLRDWFDSREAPSVRVGYDCTATVEKSVSLVAMLSGSETQRGCVRAIRSANAVAVGWLNAYGSSGRRKGRPALSEGLTVASFFHGTSRALDPHAHCHNLVINGVTDSDGEVRAVDARLLYQEARSASAVGTAQLRWELSQLGFGWRDRGDGIWEVAGVSKELIDAFSSRRADIASAAAKIVDIGARPATRSELQEIALATRPDKQVVDVDGLEGEWLAKAAEHGWDPEQLKGLDQPVMLEGLDDVAYGRLARFLVGEDGAGRDESTFSRGDVLAAINRWMVDGRLVVMPAEVAVGAAERFLSSELAVPLARQAGVVRRADGRRHAVGEPRWTTASAVKAQQHVLTRFETAAGVRVGEVSIERGLGSYRLGEDQERLVRSWLGSGRQFQAGIGPAGTGKTYALQAVRDIFEGEGWSVVGTAVKGTTAQMLAHETGIASETVAMHRARWAERRPVVDGRTVLIVDEASMLSDRDWADLVAMCDATGAVLRCIGDPVQQGSVEAGGLFDVLARGGDTPELVTQRRLRDPAQQEAAELLRGGDVASAFEVLAASGLVVEVDDDEVLGAALNRWYERWARGDRTPMVDRLNVNRRTLNRMAQAARVAIGEVGELRRVGGELVGEGDVVIATKGDRSLVGSEGGYVANGMMGTVLEAQGETVVVDFDQVGAVELPVGWCEDHLTLGYAVTAYGVQGATVDEITTVVRPGADLGSVYVGATRARDRNEVIVSGGVTAELAPGPDERPPVEQVVRTVKSSKFAPAVVADPSVGDLVAGSEGSHRKREVSLERIRRRGRTSPSPAVLKWLGPRPATPWLAGRWDTAAESIAVWRWQTAATGTTRGAEQRAMTELLGVRSADHGAQWDEIADLVADTVVVMTLRRLQNHVGSVERPQMPFGAASSFVVDTELGARTSADLSEATRRWHLDDQAGNDRGVTDAERSQLMHDPPPWLTAKLAEWARAGALTHPVDVTAIAASLWEHDSSGQAPPEPKPPKPKFLRRV